MHPSCCELQSPLVTRSAALSTLSHSYFWSLCDPGTTFIYPVVPHLMCLSRLNNGRVADLHAPLYTCPISGIQVFPSPMSCPCLPPGSSAPAVVVGPRCWCCSGVDKWEANEWGQVSGRLSWGSKFLWTRCFMLWFSSWVGFTWLWSYVLSYAPICLPKKSQIK